MKITVEKFVRRVLPCVVASLALTGGAASGAAAANTAATPAPAGSAMPVAAASAATSATSATTAATTTTAANAAPSGEVWPVRPLRFVVPYPPGGPLDGVARMLAERVREDLGQPMLVENRAGAGGNIGVDVVARSAPDGYTLVMGAVATHAINPLLFEKLSFDPIKDFAPVTLVASVPNVLVVNKAFATTHDIQSVADLVAYAKAHPGQLNYGSGGNGSTGHLAGELFKARSKIDAVHVPYQGAAPAQMALLGAQSDFMFDNLAAAAPLIANDSVRALAVTTARRSGLLAQLPTMQEAGVPGFDLNTWFGVFAPAGTPQAVIGRLYQSYAQAMTSKDVQARLRGMGSEAAPMPPSEFAAFVVAEQTKYKTVVELSGARLD